MENFYDTLKTPQELYNYIENVLKEGIVDRVYHDIYTPEHKKYLRAFKHPTFYRTLRYDLIPDNGYVTIFDKIEFARFWLGYNKYDFKVIFIGFDHERIAKLPFHVFITYKDKVFEKTYYRMEFTEEYNKGIHRYSGYKNIFTEQHEAFLEYIKDKKTPGLKYLKINEYDHIFNASYDEYLANTCNTDFFTYEIDMSKNYIF